MKNLFNPAKTVNLYLVGVNGNAFALMGEFQKRAMKEGWTTEEIKVVLDECMSSDYDHLLATLLAHTDIEDLEDIDDDEDDPFYYNEYDGEYIG